MRIITALILILLTTSIFAHGTEKHEDKSEEEVKEKIIEQIEYYEPMHHQVAEVQANKMAMINKAYLNSVKPIFKRACFDCHGKESATHSWYYKIPGVKQYMNGHMGEAKKHLDFSNDYPFVSHDSPVNDLKSIRKDIADGKMPLWQYSLMHSDAKLSDADKKIVNEWITNSLRVLEDEK